MAISRRRKKIKRKPRVLNAPIVDDKDSPWQLKIHASKVVELRSNLDFLAMIKVGRAVNAVSFALTEVLNREGDKSVEGRRQYRRAFFVLGGYLHQSISLISGIKGRYLGDPLFEPLRALVLDVEHKKVREIARKIRNSTAFHLDESDEHTRKTLSRLKPASYTLISTDPSKEVPFYSDLADEVDMAFLLNEFSSELGDADPRLALHLVIIKFSIAFITSCAQFEVALGDRAKIREHTYVTKA